MYGTLDSMSRSLEPASDTTVTSFVQDARRRQIAEAARRVYNESETGEVSVDEIAAAARVSRSTIYNHFEDREAILRAALEVGHEELARSLEAIVTTVEDPIERLVAVFRLLIATADANAGLYRIGLALTAGRGGAGVTVDAEVVSIGAEVGGLIRSSIEEAVGGGVDLRGRTVDSIVAFASRILYGLLNERISGLREASPATLAREAWQFLVPRAGR